METISTQYKGLIMEMMGHANLSHEVSEKNVNQPANKAIRPYIDRMITAQILEGSRIDGAENLVALYEKAKQGHSCLLLLEHYSNFDLPVFDYLVRREIPNGQEISDAIIAIAGMKLNIENPVVAAFTEAYSRIVIYPSRSTKDLDPEKAKEEIALSNTINRAAMKALNDTKKEGKLILVFPAGTRYRPWEPETKKGVREIDSYIKSFDYMCLVSINGDLLRIQKGKMVEDLVCKDSVLIEASPVLSCEEFREKAKEAVAEGEDRKQVIVDSIMAELERMHIANEAKKR